MADKANSSISASVLKDSLKAHMSGGLEYTPADASEKWVYVERKIGVNSEPLLTTSDVYIDENTNTGAPATVAASDVYRWLCIKNTGTTDGSTSSSEAIVVSLDGDNAAVGEAEGVLIGPGEMWVAKFPSATTQADVYAITVDGTASGLGYANGAGDSTVHCIIAAIMHDV
tara:strand:- start:308 stop:820 length:513 start_codon:yes stop_codon:yes gene_type:complete